MPPLLRWGIINIKEQYNEVSGSLFSLENTQPVPLKRKPFAKLLLPVDQGLRALVGWIVDHQIEDSKTVALKFKLCQSVSFARCVLFQKRKYLFLIYQ